MLQFTSIVNGLLYCHPIALDLYLLYHQPAIIIFICMKERSRGTAVQLFRRGSAPSQAAIEMPKSSQLWWIPLMWSVYSSGAIHLHLPTPYLLGEYLLTSSRGIIICARRCSVGCAFWAVEISLFMTQRRGGRVRCISLGTRIFILTDPSNMHGTTI